MRPRHSLPAGNDDDDFSIPIDEETCEASKWAKELLIHGKYTSVREGGGSEKKDLGFYIWRGASYAIDQNTPQEWIDAEADRRIKEKKSSAPAKRPFGRSRATPPPTGNASHRCSTLPSHPPAALSQMLTTYDGIEVNLDRHNDPEATNPTRRRAHSANDLVKLCVNSLNLDPEEWSVDRKAAMQELLQWNSDYDANCNVPYFVPEPGSGSGATFLVPNTTEMDKGLRLVSRVFFGGSLNCVYFDWQRFVSCDGDGEDKDADSGGLLAYTRSEDADSEAWVRIAIDPAPGADWQDEENYGPLKGWRVSGLIHECIHAYLGLYACNSSTCPCYKDSLRALGHLEHGPAFTIIASHVKTFVATHLEDLLPYPGLGIINYTITEYRTGGTILNDADLALMSNSDDYDGDGDRERHRAFAKHANAITTFITDRMREVFPLKTDDEIEAEFLADFVWCRRSHYQAEKDWDKPITSATWGWPDAYDQFNVPTPPTTPSVSTRGVANAAVTKRGSPSRTSPPRRSPRKLKK